MRFWMCAFVLGVLVVPGLPALPSVPVLLALGLGVLLALGRRWRCVALFLCGLLWACVRAQWALEARLPVALEDVSVQVEGRVLGIPDTNPASTRFGFAVTRLAKDGRDTRTTLRQLSLATYDGALDVPAGAHCKLYVRLRMPRGTLNPGAFDYETWLFAAGIDAQGRVIPHPANHCEPPRLDGALDVLRAHLAKAITRAVPVPEEAGILAALGVGSRASMSDRQWQVLRDTGTTHMVSISGLHIAMVGLAAGFAAARVVAAIPGLGRVCAAPRLALLVGLAGAGVYAVLAGLTVPTQRSLLMMTMLALRRWQGHALLDPDGLLLAFTVVLAVDPLACLTASFWLTFGAVLALALLGHAHRAVGGLRSWAGTHFKLALALTPMLAMVTPAIAWTSPLANALLVPLVTWGVVPLVLLGMVLEPLRPTWAEGCWQLAAWAWRHLWQGLEALARYAPAWPLVPTPGLLVVLLTSLGLLALCLPFGRGRWWYAALLVAALFLQPVERPPTGTFTATVLDVGQGLSVVVETRTHVLVFDVGPHARGGRDAGADIVLPFLRARGHSTLDQIMVSHPDNDHAGGLGAVLAGLPVRSLALNPRHRWPGRVARCAAGQAWQWDGVRFEVLHPGPGPHADARENDLSCVLLVAMGAQSLLLTGDIEAAAERALLSRGVPLGATVLVVPHHGSATSSTAAFVQAVQPRWAVFSAGYRNRFGHPAQAVLARYRAQGSGVLDTRTDGAVRIEFRPDGVQIERERERAARFWRPR